jgi:hypothetical protein
VYLLMGKQPASSGPPFDPADITAGMKFVRAAAHERDFREAGRGLAVLAVRALTGGEADNHALKVEVERTLACVENPAEQEIFELLLGLLDAVMTATVALPADRLTVDASSLEGLPTLAPGEPFPDS